MGGWRRGKRARSEDGKGLETVNIQKDRKKLGKYRKEAKQEKNEVQWKAKEERKGKGSEVVPEGYKLEKKKRKEEGRQGKRRERRYTEEQEKREKKLNSKETMGNKVRVSFEMTEITDVRTKALLKILSKLQ